MEKETEVKTEQVQTSEEHFSEKMDEIFSTKVEDKVEDLDQDGQDNLGDEDKGQDDKSTDVEDSDSSQEQSEDEVLSQEVVEVMTGNGLTQETIDAIAKESPELIAIIKEEIENEKKKSSKDADKKQVVSPPAKKSKFQEIKVELDPDVVGSDVKSAIDSIVARINEQGKSLESETAKLQEERDRSFQDRIDLHFDKFSKQVPDIGISSQMTEKQYKLRVELFRHAGITSEIRGVPLEKAIEIEINKFKNQDGEKVAQQKLLDKLENQKKHFTNPPTRRHSDMSSRKFASEEERKEAVMTQAYKAAGIET